MAHKILILFRMTPLSVSVFANECAHLEVLFRLLVINAGVWFALNPQ